MGSYTNSPLISYTKLSPNHSGARTHNIDRITPHCVVGQLSVESLGNCFISPSRKASCQYGIGSDGRIGMYCEEKNRSWCSSSNENDQRAITIECASDKTHPYAFKEVVYNRLIDLCVDICKRYNKDTLLWFNDKNKALSYNPRPNEMVLTVHRWFAKKACPGDWLYNRLGDLANKVNAKLKNGNQTNDKSNNNFKYYLIKSESNNIDIRSDAGDEFEKTGSINHGIYTIIDEKNDKTSRKWGKLKSGRGWIPLDKVQRIN